ncbi:ribonuclease J, partial [Bacillus cereus]|nr:ribonuclease J [Bacillus cereus]
MQSMKMNIAKDGGITEENGVIRDNGDVLDLRSDEASVDG